MSATLFKSLNQGTALYGAQSYGGPPLPSLPQVQRVHSTFCPDARGRGREGATSLLYQSSAVAASARMALPNVGSGGSSAPVAMFVAHAPQARRQGGFSRQFAGSGAFTDTSLDSLQRRRRLVEAGKLRAARDLKKRLATHERLLAGAERKRQRRAALRARRRVEHLEREEAAVALQARSRGMVARVHARKRREGLAEAATLRIVMFATAHVRRTRARQRLRKLRQDKLQAKGASVMQQWIMRHLMRKRATALLALRKLQRDNRRNELEAAIANNAATRIQCRLRGNNERNAMKSLAQVEGLASKHKGRSGSLQQELASRRERDRFVRKFQRQKSRLVPGASATMRAQGDLAYSKISE